MTLVLFFIILGALIFVHELGHFISAKKAGIRVDEFALGFPPKIFSKKIGETVYSLNLVPFGGFVKIFGEDGMENADLAQTSADITQKKEEKIPPDAADLDRSFIRKPRWIQAIVLASGVLGNLTFAWLLISIGFLSGIPSSVQGRYANEVRDAALTITSVLPNSPAEAGGLRAGDKIIAMSDASQLFKTTDAEEARRFIAEAASIISIEFARDKEIKSADIQPVSGIVSGKLAIGVSLDTVGVVRFGVFRSFFEGALMTADLTRETTVGLFRFIKDAFLGQADFGSIAGPVGIAGLVGEARVLGLVYLISFTAFISINLAVINLLPIPALDGGRLLFIAIEGISRRAIPAKIAKALNTVGFVLLILLMIAITYRDVARLVSS